MTSARPWFVLVAGINGAGKSTFAQNPATIRELCGLTGTFAEVEIINPDLITKEIRRAYPRLSLDDATDELPMLAKNVCGTSSKARANRSSSKRS